MTDRMTLTGKQGAVLRGLDRIEKQLRHAGKLAINDVAKRMASDGNRTISSVFDRPVPRTASAVKVFAGANNKSLAAVIGIHNGSKGYARDDPRAKSSGKSSIFPDKYLRAQIDGGRRVNKRFENALIKVGAMPRGMHAVFAKRSGYLDRYGNLSGARINQILSYFAAFPEAGYRANMTAKGRQAMLFGSKNKKTGAVKFAKGRKWGAAYFVSRGARFGGLGMRLPAGIWERNYPQGPAGRSFIKPVLLFVQPTNYRPRFDFFDVMRASAERHMEEQLDKAISLAMTTAR